MLQDIEPITGVNATSMKRPQWIYTISTRKVREKYSNKENDEILCVSNYMTSTFAVMNCGLSYA